ncbi:MAG: hypothetical protein K5779_08385 [Saccharofermentans sp.]|nr:hypothetical protein [Saccharofermentans sp.]
MRQMTRKLLSFFIAVAVTMGLAAGSVVFAAGVAATIDDVDFGTVPKNYTYTDCLMNPLITNTGTELFSLSVADAKVELTGGETSAFACGWNAGGGWVNPGQSTRGKPWVRVKEGLSAGTHSATLTLYYAVNSSWKAIATSKVSVKVNSEDFGFTSFPSNGYCDKSSKFTFSWSLNKQPLDIVLQRKLPSGSWGHLNSLENFSSFSVKYLENESDTYRIIASDHYSTIYSNEFTVKWTGKEPKSFWTQPLSGTSVKTKPYTFTWSYGEQPYSATLQRYSSGSWGNLYDLTGKTSYSVEFTSNDTEKYRIKASFSGKEVYSDVFTVTWTDPLTYKAILDDISFGSKVVGYSNQSSLIFRIKVLGTGTLVRDSEHYKIVFSGDTTAFETWVSMGGSLSSGNTYDAGTVKPVTGLSKGSYKLNATLYYDQDGTGTECDWEVLDTATYTFTVSAATPTPTKKPTATPTPTKKPTATPTKKPTATPTKKPTATPTKKPTATPTKKPTATPTKKPTATPTKKPTATPTKKPTATPTKKPTATPTKKPTVTPTKKPTATPTKKPTATSTKKPTVTPTPMPKSKWVKEGNNWYYYDSNGKKATGWVKDGSNWYYCDKNGVMQIGWVQDGDKWYYMGPSGAMVIGWVQAGDKWYYMGPSGAMVTGWIQVGTNWYYMGASGAMATGWVQSGNTWYYMNSSGAMVTGWQKAGDKWYYFDSNGAMQTKWLQIGDKWYFLHPETGEMMTGKVIINGEKYLFDDSGVLIGTFE